MGTTFTHESFIVAEAVFDPTQVYGQGGCDYPRLVIPIKMVCLPYGPIKDTKMEFLFYTARSTLSLGNSIIAECFLPFYHRISSFRCEELLLLEFPLDRFRVERIESQRKGDLGLNLRIWLNYSAFGISRYAVASERNSTPVHQLGHMIQDMSLPIPQRIWREDVLPGLGYGMINIIELPAVPLENIAALKNSYEAMKRGQERFKGGDYDEAVAFCRQAIEPIRHDLKRIKDTSPTHLGADWGEKVGSATVEWLTIILGKTHGVANAPHHVPCLGHFNRLDAQMILTVTASVLAFVARTVEAPQPNS